MGTETTRKFELSLLIAALGSKMKAFFSFVVIFAAVALVANADKATNDFLDQLLDNARPTIAKELDPIKLPEKRHRFSKKIIFVTVHGEASVYNGYIHGLTNLHRSGEASMTTEGDCLVVRAHAGINNLKGQYSAKATFMNLGPHLSASLSISSVSVRLGIKQALKPDAHPELIDFKIEHISGIKVHVGGLGPLGWILGGLTTFIVNILKDVIANAVDAPIRNVIRNELRKVKIPF